MLSRRVRSVLRRRRGNAPVSVVVTVGPRQGKHLAECLDSLARQSVPAGQILLGPWGELDQPAVESGQLPGVEALPTSETANDARNRAAHAASGEAVLFLEATQTLSPRALGTLVEALGSSVAVVADASGALGGRLWARAATPRFDARHGRFPHAALVGEPGARVPGRLVHHTDRSWATPFAQPPPAAAELPAFTALLGDLSDEGELTTLLTEELPAFLDDLEHAPVEAREAFADGVDQVLTRLSPDALLDVPVHTRIRAWLVARRHHEVMWQAAAEKLRPRGQSATAVVDGRILADHSAAEDPWAGITIPERVREIRPELTASLRTLRREGDHLRLGVYAGLRWLDSRSHAPRLEAQLVHAETGERQSLEVEHHPGDHGADRFFAQRHQDHTDSSFELAVDLTTLGARGRWHLEVAVTAADIRVTGRVRESNPRSSAGLLDAGPLARPVLDRTGFHLVVGEPSRPAEPVTGAPVLTEVSVEGGLRLVGSSDRSFTLELVHAEWRIPVELSWRQGGFEAHSTLSHDPWGLGSASLPTGNWQLRWSSDEDGGELFLPAALAAQTPWERLTPFHRITVVRGIRGQLVIDLAPPLREDERSVRAQTRLRSTYLASSAPIDPDLALFWSYAGTGATDSPRAIYEELRRRRPELRCRWMVAHRGVQVPAGAEPLLVRSQEWYAALATAGLIVTNIEMDPFFTRRPGQSVVQTFHGHPAKSMGIHEWQAKNFTPAMIATQLRRTSGNWTVALTPSPEMDRFYREQYAYEGTILHRGYPRDDALVGPDANRIRQEARGRLGIGDHQIAVLYAPTWREEEATNFRSARINPLLDVEATAAALEDHVILLRGHRFHATSPDTAARVLDVSAHPEINDLILAADVAVLDYSSLRFDFTLTGKPIVFLVPDLEDYANRGRGFLFPFTDSAPGPLVSTTEEVVTALRAPDRLRADYADAIAEFNRNYHAEQDGRSASRVVDHLVQGGTFDENSEA